jgi:glycosyltransferase involved in cell wall biosynthesis
MKIGMLCYGLNVGGVQRVAVNLSNALVELGEEVVFLYRVNGPLREVLSPRVTVIQYATGYPNYRSVKTWLTALSLFRILRRFRIDIVHSYDVVSWAIGSIACRFAKVPHVRTQPNFIRTYERLNAKTLRWSPFGKWTDAFHAIFNATALDLIRVGVPPYKIFIEPGVLKCNYAGSREIIRNELGVEENAKVVITVGRLVPGKGFELIPKIASLVAAKFSNVHFWIVGDGPLRAWLEEAVSNVGIKGLVHFLGERIDVNRLYEAADVGLFPTGSHAGMVEAIAYVPLVAGRGECQNEYIVAGNAGIVCENIQDYVDALVYLLNNDKVRERYKENAKMWFRSKYAVEAGASRFVEFYKRVMTQHKP